MEDKMIANLEEKYGKKLSAWIKIVEKCGETKHMAIVKHLKTEYELTHGYANLIAHKAKASDSGTVSELDLVAAQYKGKEALQPIYDKLIKAIKKFGKDVEIAPKKSYVSLRRKKQFGLIQASTKTRVDVGINLKGQTATDRLEHSGSFNAMVSHRVRMEDVKDVDKELIAWLKEAYQSS